MERESMEFDVVIVGAGPAGLAAAIRLMQLGAEAGEEVSVCLVEKGSEVGAHILSGAILAPKSLNELLPDWQAMGAPVTTPVTSDEYYMLTSAKSRIALPRLIIPRPIHNKGNYAISLGNLCRWLGEQAEEMGVNVFPRLRRQRSALQRRRQRQGGRHRRHGHRQGRRNPRTPTSPATNCMPSTPCSPKAAAAISASS